MYILKEPGEKFSFSPGFDSFDRMLSRQIGRCGLRLNSTLALVEATGNKITPASFSALKAAQELGSPITALLLGPDAAKITEQLKGVTGVSKILTQSSEKYQHILPETLAPLLVDVIKANNFTNVLTPASAMGKSVLPRASAMLDVQPLSDITKVVDAKEKIFVRPTYAGNAILTVKVNEPIVMASVRASAFPAAVIEGAELPPVEEIADVESTTGSVWKSEEIIKSDKPDLGSSKVVVSGGRALKDKETFASLLNPLAEKLGAAIGASRVAVDEGFCDNSLQVGQTGKIIAPELYIAVGISGAIQHLAGMKDSKVIVAINKDEEAPIFKVADVGLVGDIYEILPELTSKI